MADIKKACFFTGHRIIPPDIKDAVKTTVRRLCVELIEDFGVTDFIAGGALGFDTLAETVVLELRRIYPDIKLRLYLPCRDQTKKWRAADAAVWERILNEADDYRYITDGNYVSGCMQARNREMVNDAYYGIAYCTHDRSGTASTVKYAVSLNRKIKVLK